MHRLLLIGCLGLFGLSSSRAQQFEWGNAISGLPATPWKISSAISSDGYVVAGGYFINSSGNDQPFLTRIDPDGNSEWVHVFETGSSCYIEAVAIHADGSIRIGGWAGPDSDIDPGPGVHIIPGEYNAYIASFLPDGTFQDVDTMGSGKVQALHFDKNNNLFLTGMMTFNEAWDMDLGPGKYLLTPAAQSSAELVLAKYDSTGKLLWASQTYGQEDAPGNSSIKGLHLGTDDLGHVFVSGHLSGPGTVIRFKLGANPIQVTPGFWTDLFVARFQSSNGAAEWVRVLKGEDYENTLRAMSVRNDGQVALSGGFRDTLTVSDPSGTYFKLAPYPMQSYTYDIFMASYNVQGQAIWAHALIGAKSETADGLSWTSTGDLWTFGKLGTATVDFDPGSGTHNVTSFGLFLARYSDIGTFHWVYTIPADYAFQLIPYGTNGYLTASRTNTNGTDFDLTPKIQNIGLPQSRGVLVRYNDCDIIWSQADGILCPGESQELDGTIIDSAGIYSGVFVSQAGCDSVLTLTVTQVEIDTSVQAGFESLFAESVTGNYQWIDCVTGMPVAGATTALFNPVKSGNYAVIVSENNCSDTSACYQVTLVNTTHSETATEWNIWPVPTREDVHIMYNGQITNTVRIEIWTVSGVLIQTQEIMPTHGPIHLSVDTLHPGSYICRIHNGGRSSVNLPIVITW